MTRSDAQELSAEAATVRALRHSRSAYTLRLEGHTILKAAGLVPENGVPVKCVGHRRGIFSSLYWVTDGGSVDYIIKVHPHDFAANLQADSDDRFHEFGTILPLSPYFVEARPLHERFDRCLRYDVPVIIAEGIVGSSHRYTIMTRLPGRTWPNELMSDPSERRRVSFETGRIARELREGTTLRCDSAEWVRSFTHVLLCLADHLPEFLPRQAKAGIYRRISRLAQRLRKVDLGPLVIAHGDLHPSNLLFDDDLDVRGLVDLQLTCPAPAAMDLRHLDSLDTDGFLEGYSTPCVSKEDAIWAGRLFHAFWELFGLVVRHRFTRERLPPSEEIHLVARIDSLLHSL